MALTLKMLRELLQDLKQEQNLTTCACLVERSLWQQLEREAGGPEGASRKGIYAEVSRVKWEGRPDGRQ